MEDRRFQKSYDDLDEHGQSLVMQTSAIFDHYIDRIGVADTFAIMCSCIVAHVLHISNEIGINEEVCRESLSKELARFSKELPYD